MYYMAVTYPFFRDFRGHTPDRRVPVVRHQRDLGRRVRRAGRLLTIWIVSLLTPEPDREVQELVDHVRYPVLAGDIETRGT